MTVLPEKDQEVVQSTMQKSFMESAKFLEIRFESTSICNEETRSITMDVQDLTTQFGIHPVSVARAQ